MAGQMIDFQVGFSMASYYDPYSIAGYPHMEGCIIGGDHIVLALNGHHYLIYTLAQSFKVPLNTLILQDPSLALW